MEPRMHIYQIPFGQAIPAAPLRCACGTETARDADGNPRQHKDPRDNPCEVPRPAAELEPGLESDADADATPCACGLYVCDGRCEP